MSPAARRASAGALVAAALATSAFAAPPPRPPRIVLAVDGVQETRNLPVLLAERLGYFRDAGLTVTLVDSPGEPTPAQLMKDGRADGAVAYYHHTFVSQASDGMVTEAVATLGVTPGLKLMVATRLRGQVAKVADLKGRRIYAGGADSGKTTTANWLMAQAGLGVGDYTRLPNVSPEKMAADLRAGAADAIVAHEPEADELEAAGVAFTLADVQTVAGTRASLGSVFPSTALYLPRDYVLAHPREVQALVSSCVRALGWLNTHSGGEIAAVLPPKMGGKDRTAFVRLLDEDKQMFATDGRMPEAAARREWQVMSQLTPKYGRIRFDQTFTNAFVDKALGAKP